MEYLTVGTNEIKKELFVPVEDREPGVHKPRGGMWFTKHRPEYPNYNDWVEYLVYNPDTFLYKSKGNIWEQPISVIGLDSGIKIFTLNDLEKYQYLLSHYTLDKDRFSYAKLSEEYDGIFVDTYGSFETNASSLVKQYSVPTLLLFNLDHIDYYYPGKVSIEPFDFEFDEEACRNYTITYDKVKRKVK